MQHPHCGGVKMYCKTIGALECGLLRQVVFEHRGLIIQGPLYWVEIFNKILISETVPLIRIIGKEVIDSGFQKIYGV